jgi:hypothetical protein
MPSPMLFACQGLQVVGIHATRVEAAMVQFHTRRDRSFCVLIEEAMCKDASHPDRDAGVSFVVGVPLPNPTAGKRVDFVKVDRVRHRRPAALVGAESAAFRHFGGDHLALAAYLANNQPPPDVFGVGRSNVSLVLLNGCASTATETPRRLTGAPIVALDCSAPLARYGRVMSAASRGGHRKTLLRRVRSGRVGQRPESASSAVDQTAQAPVDCRRIIPSGEE